MNRAAELSRRLTALILGADTMYRASLGSGEARLDSLGLPIGLVPMHWSDVEPQAVESWEHAQRELTACLDEAMTLTDPWARDWCTELCCSLRVLFRWYGGDEIAFEQFVSGALRIDPLPPAEAGLHYLLAERQRALVTAGYDSYEAYLDENRLDADQVLPILQQLVSEAEVLTRQRLPHLRLPDTLPQVETMTGTPYSAYFSYARKSFSINTDVAYTAADLKHLVGHEVYPGHYVHMSHRDAMVREGAMAHDAALVITNSASTVLLEGVAESGLDLLGWRNTGHDRIAWISNRIQWNCSIVVAHALATRRWGAGESREFLVRNCTQTEAWIDGKLRFVSDRRRAPFVYAYWWGGTVVGRWWARVPRQQKDRAIDYLYSRMHSPATLAAHWAPASAAETGIID